MINDNNINGWVDWHENWYRYQIRYIDYDYRHSSFYILTHCSLIIYENDKNHNIMNGWDD